MARAEQHECHPHDQAALAPPPHTSRRHAEDSGRHPLPITKSRTGTRIPPSARQRHLEGHLMEPMALAADCWRRDDPMCGHLGDVMEIVDLADGYVSTYLACLEEWSEEMQEAGHRCGCRTPIWTRGPLCAGGDPDLPGALGARQDAKRPQATRDVARRRKGSTGRKPLRHRRYGPGWPGAQGAWQSAANRSNRPLKAVTPVQIRSGLR